MAVQNYPANAAGVPGLGLAEGRTNRKQGTPLSSSLATPGFIPLLLGHILSSHRAGVHKEPLTS